jgi:hypothetical protein
VFASLRETRISAGLFDIVKSKQRLPVGGCGAPCGNRRGARTAH